jgi:hypothetical protein
MKSVHILLALLILSVASTLSHAEIYKWKDKDGSIRYTDTPPPSNIKQETMGSKKAVKPTSEPAPIVSEQPITSKDAKKEALNKEDEAAKKRQDDAEVEKKNKQNKEKQDAVKAENCKTAKANLENYNQGGRLYRMNEKGERVYMGDKDLEAGKLQAQKDIDDNCN